MDGPVEVEEINGICPWDGTTVHRHVLKWSAQAPGRRTFTCLRGERLILASWVHPREEPLDYVTATPLADGPTVMLENEELRGAAKALRAQLAAIATTLLALIREQITKGANTGA